MKAETLIPKVQGTKNPAEIRKITVASTLIRSLHCILGARLEQLLPTFIRQKSFRRGDGLFMNSKLLRQIIDESKQNYCSLSLAFVDAKKAFDSVSHNTIWLACERGIPDSLNSYLNVFYTNSFTSIYFSDS